MSSYFVNSLSTCYGPAALDPCADPISGYDRSHYNQQPHHHHHQQNHGSLYAPSGYGAHQRYPNYHHHRPGADGRYVESAASQYYSTPRLTHLTSGSPSPPPAPHAHLNSIVAAPLSPSSSPQSLDRKLTSGVALNGSSLAPSVALNGSSTPLPNASTLQNLSTNSGAHGAPCDNGYYPNSGITNFLDENTPSCDSPPLSQRHKANKPPQQQYTSSAPPSSPPSPPSKQRSSEKGGSPNSQSDGSGSNFPAPQIYPWMRRMQYSAGRFVLFYVQCLSIIQICSLYNTQALTTFCRYKTYIKLQHDIYSNTHSYIQIFTLN